MWRNRLSGTSSSTALLLPMRQPLAIRRRMFTAALAKRRQPCEGRPPMGARRRVRLRSTFRDSGMRPGAHVQRSNDGFAMAALLAARTAMAIFLAMALPAWKTATQREKETELIFPRQQYPRALAPF